VPTKIAVFTDMHLTGKRPVHRTDDFCGALIRKLQEVYDIANRRDVDCVVFLGDFFNNHRIFSYEIINEAMDVICASKVKTYAITGQHDLVGYNPTSFKTSTLSFVERHCSQFQTLHEPLEMGDVVLYPCHVYDDFKTSVSSKAVSKRKKSVLCAHHLITVDEKPYQTNMLKDFLPCAFSAIIFGDLHIGMPPTEEQGTLVWGPGALARLAINERQRPVRCGILTAEAGKPVEVEEILLESAVSGEDVFGEMLIEQIRERPEMLDVSGFVESIRELEASSADVFEMLERAAIKEGIRKEVVDYILSKREQGGD